MSSFEQINFFLKQISTSNSYFSIRSIVEENINDEKLVRLCLRKLPQWYQQTPEQIQDIKKHFHDIILRTTIEQKQLIDLLLNQLREKTEDYLIYLLSDLYEKNYEKLFNELEKNNDSSFLIHLPDRISNICQTKIPSVFQIKTFCSQLSRYIQGQFISNHYPKLKSQIDTNISFLSQIIHKAAKLGKKLFVLCRFAIEFLSLGYTEYLWRPIYKNLFLKKCPIDPIWLRLAQYILFEPIDQILFYTIEHSNASTLDLFLSDRILHSSNLETYLTDTLLFRKQLPIKVVRTLLIYLTKSSNRKEKYLSKIFVRFLKIWTDESFIRFSSSDQHFYICQCLCLSLSLHEFIRFSDHQDEILMNILHGIRRHLESTVDYIRFRGQYLGELFVERIELFSNSNQLQFQTYDKNHSDIQLLRNLAEINSQLTDRDLSDDDEVSVPIATPISLPVKDISSSNTIVLREAAADDEDDDADSEFESYDCSHDTAKSDVTKPSYIRACLADLIATDNVQQLEAALQMLPTLIEMYKIESEEVALELTRILLNYNSSFNIENFDRLQLNGLVCLCRNYPISVSDYLCKQFYERNYTIGQRSLILKTIQDAAQKLADIEQINTKIQEQLLSSDENDDDDNNETTVDSWQTIVNKRLKLKTRRKFSQPKKIFAKENHFGNIVGYFFFPLISSIDRSAAHLSLVNGDQDYLLLCELVACLGRLCIHAQNTSTLRKMLKEYLQVLKSLQNHVDAGVRHAIVYAYACCLVSIGNQFIDEDLQTEFIELKQWLDEIIDKDSNVEVQKLGKSVRRILLKTLHDTADQ